MSRVAPPWVIFFDAADTLFHVKGSVGEAYLSLARKYGVTADRDTIQQAFVKAFDAAPPPVFAVQDPQEIKACERLWWFDVVHHVFYRVGLFDGFDEYFEEVFAYFSRPNAWELYEDTVSTLSELAARDIELGIVSNFDSRLYEILIGLGIDRFFESVTISSFAGAAKPSPAIFHRALRKHGVAARDALHIGNSLRDDARAAAAAGLRGVLLDRHGREAIPPDVVAVKSLGDVVTLVGERQGG
jgi:putative hydrolase of the HAD superfamily